MDEKRSQQLKNQLEKLYDLKAKLENDRMTETRTLEKVRIEQQILEKDKEIKYTKEELASLVSNQKVNLTY